MACNTIRSFFEAHDLFLPHGKKSYTWKITTPKEERYTVTCEEQPKGGQLSIQKEGEGVHRYLFTHTSTEVYWNGRITLVSNKETVIHLPTPKLTIE